MQVKVECSYNYSLTTNGPQFKKFNSEKVSLDNDDKGIFRKQETVELAKNKMKNNNKEKRFH